MMAAINTEFPPAAYSRAGVRERNIVEHPGVQYLTGLLRIASGVRSNGGLKDADADFVALISHNPNLWDHSMATRLVDDPMARRAIVATCGANADAMAQDIKTMDTPFSTTSSPRADERGIDSSRATLSTRCVRPRMTLYAELSVSATRTQPCRLLPVAAVWVESMFGLITLTEE